MINKKYSIVLLVVMFFSTFTACGELSVGVEPQNSAPADNTLEPATLVPTQEEDQPPAPGRDLSLYSQDNVTLGHLGIFGDPASGVLRVENGQVRVEPSPVSYGVFWDYSPQSGLLAYSAEFFHGSNPDTGEGIPISDLTVYDYQTGQSATWLDDYVSYAIWAPDGERIAAAVFNPETGYLNLVLVNSQGEKQLLAECASINFSWSPDGDALAFVVRADTYTRAGLGCSGTYLVEFPNGLDAAPAPVRKVSDFGSAPEVRTWPEDRPLWALEQNALIYPGNPFWVIPLDGSPAFVPGFASGTGAYNFENVLLSVYSPALRQAVGYTRSGMMDTSGTWVFQLSADLRTIESHYRLGAQPDDGNSDITPVSWWQYGESILVLDGDYNNDNQIDWTNNTWAFPRVWSLTERVWIEIP